MLAIGLKFQTFQCSDLDDLQCDRKNRLGLCRQSWYQAVHRTAIWKRHLQHLPLLPGGADEGNPVIWQLFISTSKVKHIWLNCFSIWNCNYTITRWATKLGIQVYNRYYDVTILRSNHLTKKSTLPVGNECQFPEMLHTYGSHLVQCTPCCPVPGIVPCNLCMSVCVTEWRHCKLLLIKGLHNVHIAVYSNKILIEQFKKKKKKSRCKIQFKHI